MSRAVALTFLHLLSCLAACGGEPSKGLPAAPSESVPSETDSLMGTDPGGTLPADRRRALPADPQLEEFLWRAQFLLRRLSAHASTREEMRRSLRAGPEGFAQLVRLSPAELSAKMDTLRWRGAVLLRRYPELAACLEEIEREEGPPCDASDALELVEQLPALVPRRIGLKKGRASAVKGGVHQAGAARHVQRRLRREDLPYVASLILSAATGNPVLYFVGSALAARTCAGS